METEHKQSMTNELTAIFLADILAHHVLQVGLRVGFRSEVSSALAAQANGVRERTDELLKSISF